MGDLVEDLHRARGLERGPAGEHLVQGGTQGVDVGGGANLVDLPPGLLGGHVAGRADHLAGEGVAVGDFEPLGQPEVGDLGDPGAVEQDVGRLEVAMHDAGLVRRVHGGCERGHQLGRRAARLGGAAQAVGEASPLEPFERHEGAAVGLAEIIDLDDVGMAEAGDGLGLDQEPGALLRPGVLPFADHLQGDDPVEPAVPRPVDDAHAAPGDLTEQFVITDRAQSVGTPRTVAHGPGEIEDVEAGSQTAGDLRVIGQQLLRVDGPAGFDVGQVGLEDAGDFQVEVRGGGAVGCRLVVVHELSSSSRLRARSARVQSLRTALGERPIRIAISSIGTCSRLRRTKTSR